MFITFEGIEGSGKTTRMQEAGRFLQSRGYDLLLTREPGGTALGERIRAILLSPEQKGMDPTAELLLYMADRADHVNTLIRPALAKKKVVLCDRYFDATLAYQGYARGLDIELLRAFHRTALNDFMPDLTFLLDLPPEIGLSRALGDRSRSDAESRFEQEALDFHARVRAGYLSLADEDPERFIRIDAAAAPESVDRQIRSALEERFPEQDRNPQK